MMKTTGSVTCRAFTASLVLNLAVNSFALSFPEGPTVQSRKLEIKTHYYIDSDNNEIVESMPVSLSIGIPSEPVVRLDKRESRLSDTQQKTLASLDFFMSSPGTNVVKAILDTYEQGAETWNPEEQNVAGICYLLDGQIRESADLFEQLLERNPEDWLSAYRLAVIYTVQDRESERAATLARNAWQNTAIPRVRNFAGVRALIDNDWQTLGAVCDELLESPIQWSELELGLLFLYSLETENAEHGISVVKQIASSANLPDDSESKDAISLFGVLLDRRYGQGDVDYSLSVALKTLKTASQNHKSFEAILKDMAEFVKSVHEKQP